MLAGFIEAVAISNLRPRITCCTPHDIEAMRLRFPQIEWSGGEIAEKDRLISQATVWLGLGGTPFQTDSGNWFWEHLKEELRLCRRHNIPVFFLGIGVEGPDAVKWPEVISIVQQAKQIWTRDEMSAKLLSDISPRSPHIQASADLANIYFKSRPPAVSNKNPCDAGLVINIEKLTQLNFPELCDFIARSSWQLHWIAQEVRCLQISEVSLWEQFPPPIRHRLIPAFPDYHNGSLESFLSTYDRLAVILSSRYHSALAAAWRGSAVAIYPRSPKLEGLILQLSAGRCESISEDGALAAGLSAARTVPIAMLEHLALKAEAACAQFSDCLRLLNG